MDNTRPGIPAIAHEECLTGFTTHHASVFPTALAWAAAFNPDLVEPGEFTVMVGTSSTDIRLAGTLRLTGPTRRVGHARVLRTPARTG
jgi:hypothetical protein